MIMPSYAETLALGAYFLEQSATMPAVLLKWVTIPLMGYHTLRCATRKNFQLFSDWDYVCSSYRDHITLQIPLQQKLDNYSHDNITSVRPPA